MRRGRRLFRVAFPRHASSRPAERHKELGLITLEWIILVAAITGIVTMALLYGWDALWNRSDNVAASGGSGAGLAAERAAAEAEDGRACAFWNDLYSDATFRWVADLSAPSDRDECFCSISPDDSSNPDCPVTAYDDGDAIPVTFVTGNTTPITIDVSGMFYSSDDNLRYAILSPIIPTSIASAAVDNNSGVITITPVGTATAGDVGTIKVEATGTTTNPADSTIITSKDEVEVTVTVLPLNCPGVEITDPAESHRLPPSIEWDSAAINATERYDLRAHFAGGDDLTFTATVTPSSRDSYIQASVLVIGNQDILEVSETASKAVGPLLVRITATNCRLETAEETVSVFYDKSTVETTIPAQTIPSADTAITVDLSTYFPYSGLSFGTDAATSDDQSLIPDANLSITGSNLVITKGTGTGSATITIKETSGPEIRKQFNVTVASS